MKIAAFLLLALLPLSAFAADFSADRIKKDIAEASETNAKLLKIWAKSAKQQVLSLRGKARTDAKAALARLEKQQPPAVPLLFGPYNAGEWGVLYDCSVKVIQIVDDSSLIGRTVTTDEDSEGQLVWVKGYDTSDLTDEDTISMQSKCAADDHNIVKITTTRYQTILGQRTVLLIEPMDVTPYADLIWPAKPEGKPATKTASAGKAK